MGFKTEMNGARHTRPAEAASYKGNHVSTARAGLFVKRCAFAARGQGWVVAEAR